MTSDPPEDRNPEPPGGSGFNKTARRAARLITILAERWPLRSAGPLNLDDLSAIWWSGWDAGYRHGARGVNGDAIRARAIPAAVTAAGPAGTDLTEWQARVTDFAARITAMAMDGSDIARVIDGVAGSKRVSGTITAVAREESSTRAVATLQCKPSSWHPDGIEVARTERTDWPTGLAMARRLQDLVGHRVLLWIEVQSHGDGKKFRVIRHVEALGDPG